ncbi:MAG: hypothetical protein RI826_10350 [Chlorobium phaeovibrioides]|nr:hypothetical protein [Chlorobium phaeovibrioides]
MNLKQKVIRRRSILDTIGLVGLLGLVVINAFHFNLLNAYLYYREFFSGFFLVLIARYAMISFFGPKQTEIRVNHLLFYLLLFPLLLYIWSFIDFNVSLYGVDELGRVSAHINDVSLSLYVLRNALLYLPMVVYIYLRGLNLDEIRIIAFVVSIVVPFSIMSYMQSVSIYGQDLTLGMIGELGGQGIAYNSYVPYLTFGVLCAIYLLYSQVHPIGEMILIVCISYAVIFIFLSTSRQSTLFVLISFIAFVLITGKGLIDYKKWFISGAALVAIFILFDHFTDGYVLADKIIDRYSGVDDFLDSGSRGNKVLDGLSMLSPFELLIGAGLTSVIVSGPHNDYVRWTQRVGVPLMIFGFYPFFFAFKHGFRLARLNSESNTLFLFITLAVGYTLFHSLFGYPREDANQAVVSYLGLALWFGAYSEGLLNLNRQEK